MPLKLSTITFSNPVDKTEIEDNFKDIQAKFNGNLTNADFSSAAAISTSKLETEYERMTVTLRYHVTYDGTNERTWGDLAAFTTVDAICLPGDSSDTDWDLVDGMWTCSNVGDGTATFDVVLGRWDNTTGVVGGSILFQELLADGDSGNGAGMQKHFYKFDTDGATTLTWAAGTQTNLHLRHRVAGTGVMDTYGDFLAVSLTLRRKVGVSEDGTT